MSGERRPSALQAQPPEDPRGQLFADDSSSSDEDDGGGGGDGRRTPEGGNRRADPAPLAPLYVDTSMHGGRGGGSRAANNSGGGGRGGNGNPPPPRTTLGHEEADRIAREEAHNAYQVWDQ